MRRVLRAVLLVVGLALGAQLLGGASASASITPYNEPVYTKTAGNNAFFYRWTAVTGSDENANTRYDWYLCFNTYHMYPNGSQVQEEFSSGTNGPGTQNCTTSLRSGPTPAIADYGAMPYNGTGTVLQDGHRYDMCAGGFYKWPYLWKWDGFSACPWTIIDRNTPQITVTLAGGAASTSSTAVPVSIGYSDATSPPWAGSGGVASNWVCIGTSPCTPGGQPSAACSSPADPASRTTSFACTATVGGAGRWYVCAMAADGAVPDNPSGTNQFANATSNNANLSTTVCDDVTVDLTPPTEPGTPTTPTTPTDPNPPTTPGTPGGTPGPGAPGASTPGPGSSSTESGNPTGAAGGGAASVIAAPSPTAVSRENGGGATQQLKAGGLRLVAPKRLVLTSKRRTLRLRAALAAPGTATVTLARGSKRIARGTVRAKRAGTVGVALRLPPSLRAGRYTLIAAFSPAKGKAVTRKATITVRRPASRARPLVGIPLAG